MATFQERLDFLRKEKQVTQQTIAKAIEVTPQAFSYYMNGREPSYEILIRIADYFNVSVDFLLGRVGYRNVDTLASISSNMGRLEQMLKENLHELGSTNPQDFTDCLIKIFTLANTNSITSIVTDKLVQILSAIGEVLVRYDDCIGDYFISILAIRERFSPGNDESYADGYDPEAECESEIYENKDNLLKLETADFIKGTSPIERQIMRITAELLEELTRELPGTCESVKA